MITARAAETSETGEITVRAEMITARAAETSETGGDNRQNRDDNRQGGRNFRDRGDNRQGRDDNRQGGRQQGGDRNTQRGNYRDSRGRDRDNKFNLDSAISKEVVVTKDSTRENRRNFKDKGARERDQRERNTEKDRAKGCKKYAAVQKGTDTSDTKAKAGCGESDQHRTA